MCSSFLPGLLICTAGYINEYFIVNIIAGFWCLMTQHTFYHVLLSCTVDFGVSAQLDKTIGRRNTFIGTPYWYYFWLLFALSVPVIMLFVFVIANILLTKLHVISTKMIVKQ